MQALASGLWIRQHRNVCSAGRPGIGKNWIACALGNQAARDGFSEAIFGGSMNSSPEAS